jgi:hypothetical protein
MLGCVLYIMCALSIEKIQYKVFITEFCDRNIFPGAHLFCNAGIIHARQKKLYISIKLGQTLT